MKERLLKAVKRGIKSIIPFRYRNASYSLEGEDLILLRLFQGRREGFYVDVGALHPQRFSNTYLLSKLGWKGCNIEPNSDLLSNFKRQRPHDINLNVGVSDKPGAIDYYIFEEPAINTFDQATALHKEKSLGYKFLGVKQIEVDRLDNIFSTIKQNKRGKLKIDLLNIDVENHEWEVINSNNWTEFRPEIICIEIHVNSVEELMRNKSYQFLNQLRYELVAKTPMTCFFKDSNA